MEIERELNTLLTRWLIYEYIFEHSKGLINTRHSLNVYAFSPFSNEFWD